MAGKSRESPDRPSQWIDPLKMCHRPLFCQETKEQEKFSTLVPGQPELRAGRDLIFQAFYQKVEHN